MKLKLCKEVYKAIFFHSDYVYAHIIYVLWLYYGIKYLNIYKLAPVTSILSASLQKTSEQKWIYLVINSIMSQILPLNLEFSFFLTKKSLYSSAVKEEVEFDSFQRPLHSTPCKTMRINLKHLHCRLA